MLSCSPGHTRRSGRRSATGSSCVYERRSASHCRPHRYRPPKCDLRVAMESVHLGACRVGKGARGRCAMPSAVPGAFAHPTQEASMAKNATVSEELANKFATEKETPYLRWVRGEGLDIISAHYVPNLRTVALKPWARRGGAGVFINHEASRTSNDCYECEIPPAGKLSPQRQLYVHLILALDGRGSTTVWNDAGDRIGFEWKAGAMFAIPLNAWHQHFNGSGAHPARVGAVNNCPRVLNLCPDLPLVF